MLKIEKYIRDEDLNNFNKELSGMTSYITGDQCGQINCAWIVLHIFTTGKPYPTTAGPNYTLIEPSQRNAKAQDNCVTKGEYPNPACENVKV